MSNRRPAVFLDRDGTIIEHVHYLDDPHGVRLSDGTVDALRLLRDHGFACVVVTNQSAVGRGRLTIEQLERIHEELNTQLAAHQVSVDAIYYCPVAPQTDGDRTTIEHEDRKPGPGMLNRAAAEHNLDLTRSFMVGDMISDVLAGRNAGCRANIFIGSASNLNSDEQIEAVDYFAGNMLDAAQWICKHIRHETDSATKSDSNTIATTTKGAGSS